LLLILIYIKILDTFYDFLKWRFQRNVVLHCNDGGLKILRLKDKLHFNLKKSSERIRANLREYYLYNTEYTYVLFLNFKTYDTFIVL